MTAEWILVPCLVALRAEFNTVAPDRDHTSDGTIGDAAHQAEVSDHNDDEVGQVPVHDADHLHEVHALDVDDDLRLPGLSMQDCVDRIVARHRSGQDDRLQNVIYNRRIWSRSWGWTPHPYTGTSAHTEHAHFSARYTTAQESDTRPWGLADLVEDDVSQADVIAALTSAEGQQALQAALKAWTEISPTGDPAQEAKKPTFRIGGALRMSDVRAERRHTELKTALLALAAKDQVDENALAASLMPLLAGDQLEAVIRAGMTVEERRALAARLAL